MRVLHVVASEQRRGAEVFASALVDSLAREDVDQRVAVLRDTSGRHVSFSAPSRVVGSSKAPVPGIRLNVAGVRNLGRVMSSFRPDVVQVHGGEPLKYALAATQGTGDRIVYRRIGDAALFGSYMRQRAYIGLMRRTAKVVAVADALRLELVERLGLAPSRVVTIPNGVDVRTLVPTRSRQEVRAALGIAQDAQVVLSLAALTWEKDPLGQLEVVATRVAPGRPRLVHVMAGDGPLRSELEAEILKRGDHGNTILLGSRDDVADLLAASDVMLLASRAEGMPACAIEAGLAGLPLVAYSISGIPEVVVNGETGSLVPKGDADGLADALARLLDDEALRSRMGDAARTWCAGRFDIRFVAPRYLRLYEEIAEASSPRRATRQRTS